MTLVLAVLRMYLKRSGVNRIDGFVVNDFYMKTTFKIILFLLLMSCKENKAERSVEKSMEVINKHDSDTILYSNQSLDNIL
jgi:hypothetical protein